MVWQLRLRHFVISLGISTVLLMPSLAVAEPLLRSEKQYRLAAWHFYQQDYYQALLQLNQASVPVAKNQLLKAGLLLQLQMPAATAALLEPLLAEQNVSGGLPQQLRNIALLQFSRFQYEQQQHAQARYYLSQLTLPLNELAGQATLLAQLLAWPNVASLTSDDKRLLAGQAEFPYILLNQAQALRQQQKFADASKVLNSLTPLLQQGGWQRAFWLQLFNAEPVVKNPEAQDEQQALADYLQLLKAGVLVEQQQWAAAQQLLREFASTSVLALPAMILYRDVLIENRQIPTLLALLQQMIQRFPYAEASWLAAYQLGSQLERTFELEQALAAYQWAAQYYQAQLQTNMSLVAPITATQLAKPDTLAPWQRYQLQQAANLYQLTRQLAGVAELHELQQQRQARLAHLTAVVTTKLDQQQQLLASQLPQLTAKQQELQDHVAQLSALITAAAKAPMAELLWLTEQEQNERQLHTLLSRAQARIHTLQEAKQEVAPLRRRLNRVAGLLQWQYQQHAAERNWQLQQLQQQLNSELESISARLNRLAALEGKTERLRLQQRKLIQLQAEEQGFSQALLHQQNQLLATLNTLVQQRRLAEREQLLALQRVNTQAIARLMEQLLVNTAGGVR